jgi:hypothetical protein
MLTCAAPPTHEARTVAHQAEPDTVYQTPHLRPCDNFLYGFKGAPSARQRRASARQQRSRARVGREGKRELKRAPPPGRWRRGKAGGLSAPGASAEAAPSRVRTLPGAAADAARLSPLPPGRWLPAVTQHPASRYAKAAGGPSSVPGIVSPRKATVKGTPAARRLLRNRRPLSSGLARQDHRHLTEGRGRARSFFPAQCP